MLAGCLRTHRAANHAQRPRSPPAPQPPRTLGAGADLARRGGLGRDLALADGERATFRGDIIRVGCLQDRVHSLREPGMDLVTGPRARLRMLGHEMVRDGILSTALVAA